MDWKVCLEGSRRGFIVGVILICLEQHFPTLYVLRTHFTPFLSVSLRMIYVRLAYRKLLCSTLSRQI